MDPRGGVTSIDNLKAAGNHRVRMYIVPRAGHHGMLLVYCILFTARSDLVLVNSVLGQREGGEQATREGAQ
jgi:hypothetical protein